MAVTGAALDFGKLSAGVQKTKTMTLTFDPALTAAATFAIQDSSFTVTPTTAPAEATTVDLAITVTTPANSGTYSAALAVSGGDSGSVDLSVESDAPAAPVDTSAETYLLIKVPDYGDTVVVNPNPSIGHDGKKLTSFLRLGKFDWADEPPAARELLKLIPQVTSATNPSHYNPVTGASLEGSSDVGELGAGLVFADDIRDRPQDWDGTPNTISSDDDPAHKLTKVERFAESALLYSRGGWRDHSDGNRISTTYGDKVEVVRGNYKMIVMGRQDDTGEAMGWDVGGSHIQDFAPGTMPGASYWLEWIDDSRFHRQNYNQATNDEGVGLAQKGVWLLVNTTENVYEYARNAGNFREEIWGDVNETYVGSSNPPTKTAYATDAIQGSGGHSPPDGSHVPGRNYDYPGGNDSSRSTPPWSLDNVGTVRSNPHIIEKTWAERIDSHTGSSDCPVPHIEEKTWADKVVERTELGVGKTVVAIRQDSMTTVHGGVIDNTRILGMNIGLTSVAGMALDVDTVGGAKIDSTQVGAVWVETNAAVGAHVELGAALAHLTIDASVLAAEITFGFKLEVDKTVKFELNGLKIQKVVPIEEVIAAEQKRLIGKVQEMAADVIFLRSSIMSATGKDTYISTSTTMMAATVFIG